VLIVWFLLVVAMSVRGAFDTPTSPVPVGAIAALALPIGVFVLGRRGWREGPLRGFYELAAPTAICLQAYRSVGAFFLVESWSSRLTAGFAVPAGIGDLIVGLSAPIVAWRLRQGKPGAERLALAWNAFGLVDLVVAVALGTMLVNTRSALTSQEIFRYPLSLVPAFFVPISFILHLRSLETLLPTLTRRAQAT
jgi:hypothetical protein